MSDDQDTTAPGRVNIAIIPMAPRITVRRAEYADMGDARRAVSVLLATGWHIVEETTDGSLSADHVPAKTILEFGYRAIKGDR